jgi:EVE domain
MRYWIGVASQDHVLRGIDGGFCQVCHGKAQPLKRMAINDWLIYYSPKITFEGNLPCQAFTAIGRVTDDNVYTIEMAPGFIPYRRNIQFLNATPTPIRPLIPTLEFIKDKTRWGYQFRFGHFEISQTDFTQIAKKMLTVLPQDMTSSGKISPHQGNLF